MYRMESKTNDWATKAGIGGTQISQSRSTEQKRRGKRDTKGHDARFVLNQIRVRWDPHRDPEWPLS